MIAGIILAAGESSRLGQPKQLLPLHNGTLLGHVVALALAQLDSAIIVLGAHATEILTQANLHGATTVMNPNFHMGQASSLVAGLHAASARLEIEAVVALLGDQPTVHPDVFPALIATWRATHANAVVPRYGHLRGNPVLFPRAAWPALEASLSGDIGARALLARGEPAPVTEVALPADWWPQDIDTWEDYHALIERETTYGGAYGLTPPPPPTMPRHAAPTLPRTDASSAPYIPEDAPTTIDATPRMVYGDPAPFPDK